MCKSLVVALFLVACIVARHQTSPDNSIVAVSSDGPFSPSNARTEDGKLIPVTEFISADKNVGDEEVALPLEFSWQPSNQGAPRRPQHPLEKGI
jgi:hypothetical protein